MTKLVYIPVVALIVILLVLAYRLRPRQINVSRFQKKWTELQKLCADKQTWTEAVINADKLLDEALKRKRFNGKSMGERLVAAQRMLSDNDGVWFGHKLRNKIDARPTIKLRERDVKEALLGIRQALKDIGALPNGKSKDS